MSDSADTSELSAGLAEHSVVHAINQDILLRILAHVDAADVQNIALACKYWASVVKTSGTGNSDYSDTYISD